MAAVASEVPPVPRLFLIVVFGVAIVIGGLVAYLGYIGVIGGPIP